MTNEKVQNMIEINDICEMYICKGNMIFESDNGQILTSCHSFINNGSVNCSDIKIIHKCGILPEELFEL